MTTTDTITTAVDPATDPRVGIVAAMYEAFGRGDVAAVLAPLADDVDWAAAPGSTAAPWFGTYRGTAEVPRFFQAIGSTVDVTRFVPLALTTGEAGVMAAIDWAYTVRATGRSVSAVMFHWFRFAGDRIVAVRTLEDSAQAAEAFAS